MYDSSGELGSLINSEFQFSEKSIRLGFIRKVYGILFIQLIITVGFITLFLYAENVKVWSHAHPEMWYVFIAITFICLIALSCCPDVRRKSPTNFILLGIFTICEGLLLGSISSYYDATEVLMAVGIVTIVALALTIFAFQTKWDFTVMGGILFVFLIILLCFGLLCAIIQTKIGNIAYASLGALLFSFYLVFDTQMMIGGSHKYAISPEEYIFAALNLYLDIVNMFLYILAIIGSSRD